MRKIKLIPQASPEDDYIQRRGAEVLREIVKDESATERLVDSAYKYLNERYALMEEAGLPISMAARMDGMNHLPSSTAAPREVRVDIGNGNEARYHTQYGEVSPYTGQAEIVPFMDPVTGAPMVTYLGEGVPMDGYTKASEYVQQQLGRLTGSKVVANHGANKYDTDFATTNTDLKFDGETTRPSWRTDRQGRFAGDAIQVYTKAVDSNNPGQRANYMAPAIKRMMVEEINNRPHANIQTIMRVLDDRIDGGTYRGKRQP